MDILNSLTLFQQMSIVAFIFLAIIASTTATALWIAYRHNRKFDEIARRRRALRTTPSSVRRVWDPSGLRATWQLDHAKQLPEETPASAAARAALSASWLDATAFADLLRLHDRNGQALSRLMASGRVIGVWLPEKGAFFYPAWQLTPSNEPAPVLTELLSLLRGPYGVAEGGRTSGWEEVEWLMAPDSLLGGRSPSTMLATSPDLVLDVARQHFSSWRASARW